MAPFDILDPRVVAAARPVPAAGRWLLPDGGSVTSGGFRVPPSDDPRVRLQARRAYHRRRAELAEDAVRRLAGAAAGYGGFHFDAALERLFGLPPAHRPGCRLDGDALAAHLRAAAEEDRAAVADLDRQLGPVMFH
jgi:hypothetical protein